MGEDIQKLKSAEDAAWDFSSAVDLLRTQISSLTLPGRDATPSSILSVEEVEGRASTGKLASSALPRDHVPVETAISSEKSSSNNSKNKSENRRKGRPPHRSARGRTDTDKAKDSCDISENESQPELEGAHNSDTRTLPVATSPKPLTYDTYTRTLVDSFRLWNFEIPKRKPAPTPLSKERPSNGNSGALITNTNPESSRYADMSIDCRTGSTEGEDRSSKQNATHDQDTSDKSRQKLQPKSRLAILKAIEARKSVISEVLGHQKPIPSQGEDGSPNQNATHDQDASDESRQKLQPKSRLAILKAIEARKSVISEVLGHQKPIPSQGEDGSPNQNATHDQDASDESRQKLQPKSRLAILKAIEARKSVISEVLGHHKPLPSQGAPVKSTKSKSLPATTLSVSPDDAAARINAKRRVKLASMISARNGRPPLLPTFVPASLAPGDLETDHEKIHVFVDVSNILIGFQETLKVKRGFKKLDRTPWARFSFAQFAMLIEWGRPIAKRILVGSDVHDCIRDAQGLGYECNILKRVAKQKPLGYGRSKALLDSGASENSSDEMSSGDRAVRKREQGVDEILQLKMLESVVDTDKPAKMVLATGDAAPGEYSEGFFRMVERALLRGWAVELVSFATTRSNSWQNPEWKRRWSGKFTIVGLDKHLELLEVET